MNGSSGTVISLAARAAIMFVRLKKTSYRVPLAAHVGMDVSKALESSACTFTPGWDCSNCAATLSNSLARPWSMSPKTHRRVTTPVARAAVANVAILGRDDVATATTLVELTFCGVALVLAGVVVTASSLCAVVDEALLLLAVATPQCSERHRAETGDDERQKVPARAESSGTELGWVHLRPPLPLPIHAISVGQGSPLEKASKSGTIMTS